MPRKRGLKRIIRRAEGTRGLIKTAHKSSAKIKATLTVFGGPNFRVIIT